MKQGLISIETKELIVSLEDGHSQREGPLTLITEMAILL
jgi:hypothetical protein